MYLPLGVSTEEMLVDLVFPESLFSFFIGLFSWGHLKSILQVLEADCSNVFASKLTAFLTISSLKSSSRPRVCNFAQIEGFRPFWKNRIIISLFGVVAESNF